MPSLHPLFHFAQIGARDHYAWPRALHRTGLLGSLTTDFWSGSWPYSQIRNIRGRYHPELSQAPVNAWNTSALITEAYWRLSQSSNWDEIIRRNQYFQKNALTRIPWDSMPVGRKPVLFAYSYAALDLLREAKSRGWTTVLGQIDVGMFEHRLVCEQAELHPEFSPPASHPPPSYFGENWRKELELADYIVVNSKWSRNSLMAEGVAQSKTHLLPIPFETPEGQSKAKTYPEHFSPERPLRLLFLGQVSQRKGIVPLLQSMQEMRGESIELTVAGPMRVRLPDWVHELPNVKFCGPVERLNVDQFYGSADLFILPTLSDGFGITQLEAQSRGLPIIASQRCGEVVRHGDNGYVLESPDKCQLTRCLRTCLESPGDLERWAANSKVSEIFSFERASSDLVRMLGS